MIEFYPLFKKIKEEIDKAQNILLIAHKNPDGDALGSLLALGQYLKKEETNHILFCLDPIPHYFRFLPHSERIINDPQKVTGYEYDVVILLDSGDLEYAGVDSHFRQLKGLPVVINIDHHSTNKEFGHINLVHSKASSTSEIIYHFLDYFRFTINREVATCLLTGILTDTGNFSNLGTTPSSLEVASKLMTSGAKAKEILENTWRNKSLTQLQLWGRALSRLKKDNKTGIITTIITQKDFEELGLPEDDGTEGIANFLNNVEQAKAIMVLREKSDGTIKASLRTTQPNVDVSKIAKAFGGGGHKKAAGFTIKGKLVETENGWKVV